MAFKSQTGIGLRHSAPVIDYLNRRATGINHQYIDVMSAGVHSILHQLLDDGGWALYHLTSSNLVGNTVGKKLYDVTHDESFSWEVHGAR